MNRLVFVSSCTVLSSALLMGSAKLQQPPRFHSKDLDVTGFSGSVFYTRSDDVFRVRGAPTLHAVMPSKHMTVDAAALSGHFDPSAGALRDAILTGGVHGTLDADSSKGINKITFGGATVKYADKGTGDVRAADLNATGGVTFQSANSAQGSRFILKGSHGLFHLRTLAAGELSLSDADLDGPVSFSYAGLTMGADKKKEPSNGHGTAGQLRVTRDGTDYQLHLSGGVQVAGSGSGFDGTFTSQATTITVDEAGNFKSFAGDDTTSGTLTPQKQSA